VKKILLGTTMIAGLTVAGAAQAADVPLKAPRAAPSVFSWAGFYIGVNAGGAWSHDALSTTTVFSPTGYFAASSVPAINAVGQQRIHASGFTGGGQAGYNWQSGSIVLGVEADINYLGTRGSTSGSALYPCCAPTGFTVAASMQSGWLFTARPRIGWASNNWLFYVTGGVAVGEVKGSFTFTDTFATALESASISKTRSGWTLGGGVEVAVAGPWSFKVEYLHVDLGSASTTSTNLTAFTPAIAFPTNVYTHSADLKSDIVRAGLNYRFGGPY